MATASAPWVQRWKAFARDAAAAFAADELVCDDPLCDCDRATASIAMNTA